jgi:hypothetical protein
MNLILRSLLAAAVALSLAVPGLASADRRGQERHGYGGDRGGYKHGYKGGYHGRHYGYYPYGYYNNHDNNNNDHDDVWIGLAVGGILGYAIGGRYPYGYYPPRAQQQAYPAQSQTYGDDTCLQEREYQTTVVVGGKNVPAYGTACLQPDGSWKRDTPQLGSN